MAMTTVPPPADKPGLFARILKATGVTRVVTEALRNVDNSYFSPGQPPRPQAPADYRPRQEDYGVGRNITITPRQEEPITFHDLYLLAENDNITRLLIETRKDQIAALTWDIKQVETDEDVEVTPEQKQRIKATKDFLKSPDGEHTFDEWVRMLLEDVLVYDAPCCYVNIDNPLHTKFQVVAGMTIKRVVDEDGRTPQAPDPAYQQIIHGTVAANYSTEEMIYKPRNLRANRVYGMSPVQQIVLTVNIALRKQVSQLYFYTEGSIPDALIAVPEEWTPAQIASFQNWWDSMLAGNLQQKRHAYFVPSGTKIEMTKPQVLTDEADIWFTKIRCFAFSIPHTAFDRNTNRATAQSAKAAANEEGLAPLMQWVKDFVDCCIQTHLGQHDLEFAWVQDDVLDPADQVQVLDTQLRNGTMTHNEFREIMGRGSYGPNGDEPMIYTAAGPVMLKDVLANKAGPGANPATNPDLKPPPPQLPGGGGKPGGGKPPNGQAGGGAQAKKPNGKDQAPPKKDARPDASQKALHKAAELKTLYVSRPLTNAQQVVDWAKAQGFGATLQPDDMHVTVAFSRTPVDWHDAGQGLAPDTLRVTTGSRSVEPLGDKGAVVLKFKSIQLSNRWQQFKEAGCSWDWPGYQPHVTITYNGTDVDLDGVEPYDGPLVFGPEVFSEVVDDWEKQVTEKGVGKPAAVPFVPSAAGAIEKYSPEQPRDSHGRFGEGEGEKYQPYSGRSGRMNEQTNRWEITTTDFNVTGTLSPEEISAMENYAAYESGRINGSLIRGEAGSSPEVAGMVKNLDAVMERSTTTVNGMVYRGSGDWASVPRLNNPDGLTTGQLWQNAVGKEITMSNYLSTSSSIESAADHMSDDEDKTSAMDIKVPAGSHAISIDTMPIQRTDNSEQEVLLPRGSRYYVEGVTGHTVKLRLLP